MINVYQPTLGKEELNALEKVFESNWLGKGKRVAEFEEKYAENIKRPRTAVAKVYSLLCICLTSSREMK